MKKVLFSLVVVGLISILLTLAMAKEPGTGDANAANSANASSAQLPEDNPLPQVCTEVPESAGDKQAQKKEAETSGLKPVPLTNQDCVKCHFAIAKELDSHGEAHKDVDCLGCHEEHPPEGKNAIPSCSDCHDPTESKHFAVKGCTACHNPHEPLLIDFTKAKEAKPACLTCHEDKGEEMKAHPSAHSEQDCNNCHSEHGLGNGQYQNCLDCHEGHSPEMKVSDCLKCHKPHSPTDITYGTEIPVPLCASCHGDLASILTKSKTKHSEMTCVECHESKHGNIPKCTDCHDMPHDKFIHDKFPKCLDCHRDPHNLAK